MHVCAFSFSLPSSIEEIELDTVSELAVILAGLASLWFLAEKVVGIVKTCFGW